MCNLTVQADIISAFQSLFSWNLLLMLFCGALGLVNDMFQSLFSWNLLLMGDGSHSRSFIMIVSILVFVELALDDGRQ